MAGTVVVPENNEIPIAKNYDVLIITDTAFTNAFKTKYIYELKPKQGAWYSPFMAYPLNEDSIVKGRFQPKSLSSSFISNDGTASIKNLKNESVVFKIISVSTVVSNPSRGLIFICDRQPSILFFGDYDDPKKVYSISFP